MNREEDTGTYQLHSNYDMKKQQLNYDYYCDQWAGLLCDNWVHNFDGQRRHSSSYFSTGEGYASSAAMV